jgi:hypothetical protein
MKKFSFVMAGIGLSVASSLFAQGTVPGAVVTGQLTLINTVNVTQQSLLQAFSIQSTPVVTGVDIPPGAGQLVRPSLQSSSIADTQTVPGRQSLNVSYSFGSGFLGLTHADQRNASGGNQFSVEPPSQGLAVGDGYVVEGVNNAFQVYTTTGIPLLPAVLSTNQVFGLGPAINWATGVYGPFPTDIRVYYDQVMDRFFVLQRQQDNDSLGNLLPSSRIYLAVSQTNDPTATYNIYSMDTTHTYTDSGAFNQDCPCVADYPEIGSDQYGIYVTWNEYDSTVTYPRNAIVLAISKTALSSGVPSPTTIRFQIPNGAGYGFAVQPAMTPPGAFYFVADGGLEYFVSSLSQSPGDNHLVIWAMTNTSTLNGSNPAPSLTDQTIQLGQSPNTLIYSYPPLADQRPGSLPYAATLVPPRGLEAIDGGDNRVQSVEYVGGRLYVALETLVTDDNGNSVVGSAYVILAPVYRPQLTPALNATVVRQGVLYVDNNHLLRPAMAVNAQGNGAMVFTLVGPSYFPTAAFVPISLSSTSSTLQIAGAGADPEDGFSGYLIYGYARWGDYSAATVASDGSIWMGTEYINSQPPFRTLEANWGTFLIQYVP